MVLADLYLKNGRFRSAATSFKDVLTLNPSNERAALSLALTQIALGNSYPATAQLDGLTATAKPADIDLAYAIAGQPETAIAMLAPAAPSHGTTTRLTPNTHHPLTIACSWS